MENNFYHSTEVKSFKEDRIKLGVCAMAKKIKSKHMEIILQGLSRFNEFELVIFTEDIIFNKQVNEWPIVDALIIFFSKGFPFSKGKKYIELRNPFLINDFNIQSYFWDKRKVYKILQENQIPTPKHIIIDRGEEINNDGELAKNKALEDNSSEETEKMIKEIKDKVEKYNNSNFAGSNYTNVNSTTNASSQSNSNSNINTNNLTNLNNININAISTIDELLHEPDPNSLKKFPKNLSTFSLIDPDIKRANNNPNNNYVANNNSDFMVISDERNDDPEEREFYDIITKIDDNCSPLNSPSLPIKTEESSVDKDLIETSDYIEYKGQRLYKPFVEKPCNGDDHNIYIYYPLSHGGGHKALFRKTKNLCSYYIPFENNIRRDKSYIYEEFLQTDGFDIKVYTVGPEYAHAEARKSPSLDGRVQRSPEGKEVRYPVNLTNSEKEIARKIVNIFKQNVCGFDILRANGQNYVCDVNGWSFVKNNKKYSEDCTIILRKMILQKLNMKLYLMNPIPLSGNKIYQNLKLPSNLNSNNPLNASNDDKDLSQKGHDIKNIHLNNAKNQPYAEELRSVVAIIRHADRSPKQKMKLIIEDEQLLSLYEKYGTLDLTENSSSKQLTKQKYKKKFSIRILEIKNNELLDHSIIEEKDKIPVFNEAKLKKPNELTDVLKIVIHILEKNKITQSELEKSNDNYFLKLFQIKMVLEKNLNFEGMTRKIQIKPLKIEYKELPGNKRKYYVSKALMILKWGGNITHAGIEQAKLLGNTFRVQMYPSSLGDNNGLLRLHSTYRHDLKTYSSEEGRCLKTAAAFLMGLLELDGPLNPIISSLVSRDNSINKTLDIPSDVVRNEKEITKNEISECLNYDGLLIDKFNSMFETKDVYRSLDKNKNNSNNEVKIDENDLDSFPLKKIMLEIGNPYEKMKAIYDLIDKVYDPLKSKLTTKEIELECNSYFIKSPCCIQKRESEVININTNDNWVKKKLEICDTSPKKNIGENKINFNLNSNSSKSNKNENDIDGKEGKENKKKITFNLNVSIDKYNSNNVNQSKKEILNSNNSNNNSSQNIPGTKSPNNILDKNDSSILNNSFYNQRLDCQEEKEVLLVKRYIKLKNDFFNPNTKKFDTTKIPDIYDNIKYDLIHNKEIFDKYAQELFTYINPIAKFVMSLEYGITLDEKMTIGKKVVGPLLNKIFRDLIWWNFNNPYTKDLQKQYEEAEISYSGLDQEKLENVGIKSTLRHVKTRLYFVCASHMYTLINLLIYGFDSFLLDISENNKMAIQQLRSVFDLDYCSHIVLRLYENFNVNDDDPKRFRLEIIMSPGSDKDPDENIKNHLITVSPWIVLNNNLTLEQLKEFFLNF